MRVETPGKAPPPFPPEEQARRTGSSTYGAIFNFAKASVGSGSFTLSWGIAQAGLVLGSVSMLVIGGLSLYTMFLIVEIKRGCQRVSKRPDLDLSSMGRICMGIPGRILVDISVLICNLGVCAGYMLFIGGNLRIPLHCWLDYPPSIWLTYAIVVPTLILLTLVPSFRFLVYASMVGWCFLAIAMGTVYYYGVERGFNVDHVVLFNIEGFPLFYGVTAFLFCVHSMVIPVESEMAKPTQINVVLLIAGAVVVIVNLPFSIYGYLLFGTETKGVIFDNLPSGIFNNIVRLMLSAELTLTFPLVFKPASQIFENYLEKILPRVQALETATLRVCLIEKYSDTILMILKYLKIATMRCCLVLVSFVFAIFVPYFQFMAALVGGFATTLLAFIWPPLFHFLLLRKETNILRNIFHIVLLLVGIASIVSTTVVTVLQIVHKDATSDNSSAIICDTTPIMNVSHSTHSNPHFLLSGTFH